MKLHRLAATFGRLNQDTLELSEGLNILQAPNESGKSTWCAFLSAMFYGINSRERDKAGFIADKNRYAPWSGSPMQGRVDCIDGAGRELTLMRATTRASAPMGAFRALYTGGGEPVPELTGANCGEALLGVPREVFERSAFIRQAGLGVTADPELERRIAALISSGEEGISYSQAAEALKRQLHRRRFNQRGELPAAEAELATLEDKLCRLEQQRRELSELRSQAESLTTRQAQVDRQLTLWQAYRAAQSRARQEELESQARQAQARSDTLRRQAAEDRIPENEAIARLRGAIVNLETTRKATEKTRDERDEALKQQLRTEANLGESPFAGMTAEAARRAVQSPPEAPCSPVPVLLALLAGAALYALSVYFLFPLFSARFPGTNLPHILYSLPTLPLLMGFIPWLVRRRSRQSARLAALRKRFGTAEPAELEQLLDTYMKLAEALEQAQAEANARSAAADSLYNTLSSNEQAILLEVRRFAPTAFSIPAADQLLREAAQRRRQLAEAETAAREARLRLELLARQTDTAVPAVPAPEAPPETEESALIAEQEELRTRLADLRSRADQLTGRIAAAGDGDVLSAQAEELRARIRRLSGEYDALALALEALGAANTELQNRFSPALGRRTAEIFHELTGGRYTGVVLDRAFRLSAEPAGDSLYRDARLLSAGALDQLYLAVRLAICELVLPTEKNVPLILDDALANFDDDRCAAALKWLRQEAERRQVILFTCHSREAEFFRNDPAVQITHLA